MPETSNSDQPKAKRRTLGRIVQIVSLGTMAAFVVLMVLANLGEQDFQDRCEAAKAAGKPYTVEQCLALVKKLGADKAFEQIDASK